MAADGPAESASDRALDWVPVLPGMQVHFQLGWQPDKLARRDLVCRCYQTIGDLDIGRLETCLGQLSARHDALRLSFARQGAVGMVAATDPVADAPLVRLQLTGWSEESLSRYVLALGKRMADGWSASTPGSVRWALLRLSPQRHLLATWYVRPCVDAKSISMLERDLWAAYFDPTEPISESSFLTSVRRRGDARQRESTAFWAAELDRAGEPAAETDPAQTSATRDQNLVVTQERLAALRRAADRDGLSVAQLVAHRFARYAHESNGGRPVILNHFVDDRETREREVIGNFAAVVPVVLEEAELATPRASVRSALRAFARRPRRSGHPLPPGFLGLQSDVRAFSYNYLPSHYYNDSVRPHGDLRVTEFNLGKQARDHIRLRLNVVERLLGGLEFQLSYHPEMMPDQVARRALERVVDG